MKPKQFIRKLMQQGVLLIPKRGKGSHVWVTFQGKSTTVPKHGDKDLGNDLMKSICQQLGIDPKKILKQ